MRYTAVLAWAVLLLSALSAVAAPVEDPFGVERALTPSNFSLTQSGAWLVEFYSPRCFHCRNFAPKWHQVVQNVDDLSQDPEAPFTLARVNCYEWMDLCSQQEVPFFPDGKLYVDGQLVNKDVLGDKEGSPGQNAEKLIDFVKTEAQAYKARKLGVPITTTAVEPTRTTTTATTTKPGAIGASTTTLEEATPSSAPLAHVQRLTEFGEAPIETVDQLTAFLGADRGQGPSFVKFYSLSCPHCRAMAQAYEEAAAAMLGQVNPLAINCQKYMDVCTQFAVDAWPTLQLFRNGTKSTYDIHAKRTKGLFLSWLAEQGVYTLFPRVDASQLDATLQKDPSAVLYVMPASDVERRMVEQASFQLSSSTPFYVSTDATVARRYGLAGSALLVFAGNARVPMAQLPLTSVRGFHEDTASAAMAQWLSVQSQPVLTEVSGSALQDTMQEAPAIVLGVFSSSSQADILDALIQSLHDLSMSWRTSSDLSHRPFRFLWLDVDRFPSLLADKYHIRLDHTPALFAMARSTSMMYMYPEDHSGSWLETKNGIQWLDDISQGRAHGKPFGTVLSRTMTNVRTSSPSVVRTHPSLTLLVFVGVLLLFPRVRRSVWRKSGASQGYRKIV